MAIETNTNIQASTKLLFLFLFFMTLSKYGLQIGFSLKPYMLLLAVMLLWNLNSLRFHRLFSYETALLLFYFFYSASGAFALYTWDSLRIILGIVLVLFFYFIMRAVLHTYSRTQIEAAISLAGILFNAVSLGLYIAGLQSMNLQFAEGRGTAYGLMIDRAYPRLIGLLDDPNIYIFYNTIFFVYFLCNLQRWHNRAGLLLAIITSVLTLSRGGLAALLLICIGYVLLHGKRLKALVSGAALLLVCYAAAAWMKFDIAGIIEQRIQDFQTDGGSGRFMLWQRGLSYFAEHPFTGIGAFNFSTYNTFLYGEKLFVHNTFIEILAESGLFTFVIYLLFLFLVIREQWAVKLHRAAPYLLWTYIAFLLQMISLTLILNEMFFVYLAVLSAYLRTCNGKEEQHEPVDHRSA